MRQILTFLLCWLGLGLLPAWGAVPAPQVASWRMVEQAMTLLEHQPAWNTASGLTLTAVTQVAARYDADALYERATAYVATFVDDGGAIAGMEQMAEETVQALCELLEVAYQPKASTTDRLYRVQVGAYAQKENAVAMLNRLKAAGFDAIVV